jgi:hypothetical protein
VKGTPKNIISPPLKQKKGNGAVFFDTKQKQSFRWLLEFEAAAALRTIDTLLCSLLSFLPLRI